MGDYNIPADVAGLVAQLAERVAVLEREAANAPQLTRTNATGNTDSNLTQGNDITTDGTNRMQLVVTPTVPSWWIIDWRTLVDHDDATAWRRADFVCTLSPADADGRSAIIGGEGQMHHASAGDYCPLGGHATWKLAAGTTYTTFIRLVFNGGVATWRYHRSPEHTNLSGLLIPR